MRLNCLETKVEKTSNLPVSVTFGYQVDDPALPRRELRSCLCTEKPFKVGFRGVGREETSMCR